MNEFKLEFYFNLLKDKPSRNRQYFREMFKSKYGDFELLDELIGKIEKYQIGKYGEMVYDFSPNKEKVEILEGTIDNYKKEQKDRFTKKRYD